MTEETGVESIINQLGKRIDEQARFTRSVIIICSLMIVGIQFYAVTETFNSLPALVVASFMGRMEPIQQMWKRIESSERGGAKPVPPPPPPGK